MIEKSIMDTENIDIGIAESETGKCLLENKNIMLGISIVLKELRNSSFHYQTQPCFKCKRGYKPEECNEIAAQFKNIETSLTKIGEIIG